MTPHPDLSRLDTLPLLAKGAHKKADNAACIMEAVAFVAGERWSDHPACACPVISAFLRTWNDDLPDDERDALLRPLVPLLVGTRSTTEVERRRATMAADWLIREHTPAWLRLAGLTAQADALANLPEITDMAQCPLMMPTLDAVQKDANAAGAVAKAAAWAAAGVAARAAAEAAAGDAARDAAWDAAWATARAAARDAARAAVWAAIKPTTVALQQSALALVHRMIGTAA